MQPTETPHPPTALPIATLRLTTCPRCEYSLTGLPETHRCPECGFEYDDRTFVLTGIARGTTSMKPERKAMWIFLGLMLWFGPALVSALFSATGVAVLLTFVGFAVALLIYLLATGTRERRGVEKFIFSAGGFGFCTALSPTGVLNAQMIPWREVDTALVERKGATWYRIRISESGGRDGRPQRTCFDVGVRCTEPAANWIRSVLTERIRNAHASQQTSDQFPAGN